MKITVLSCYPPAFECKTKQTVPGNNIKLTKIKLDITFLTFISNFNREYKINLREMTSSKPKLHNDILILMVEKIFFQKPEGVGNTIDLREGNPYTMFMAHKPITETAFITQFAKLRRIEFLNLKEGKRDIEFHKDEEKSAAQTSTDDQLYTGPWYVSNMLLEEIIIRKKLRVTNVSTLKYLQNRETCCDLDALTNSNSLECFCILFLGKTLNNILGLGPLKNDDEYDLAIKKLEIDERPEDIEKNFGAILAINSKELMLDAFNENLIFDCSSLPRQVTADNTAKITIKSYVDLDLDAGTDELWFETFVSNSKSCANFLIETCPNLTALHFGVDINITFSVLEHVGNLNALLSDFINEFLKPLDKGNSDLKICLTWTIYCGQCTYEHEELQMAMDHEFFTIGAKFTVEGDIEPDTARIVEVADAKGRGHECILEIYWDFEYYGYEDEYY